VVSGGEDIPLALEARKTREILESQEVVGDRLGTGGPAACRVSPGLYRSLAQSLFHTESLNSSVC